MIFPDDIVIFKKMKATNTDCFALHMCQREGPKGALHSVVCLPSQKQVGVPGVTVGARIPTDSISFVSNFALK